MFDKIRFRNELEELVNIDSGSFCLEGVRKVNAIFASAYEKAGWKIKWYEHSAGPLSNSFLAYNGSIDDNLDLLLLCHTDTVFPQGEAAKRPFSISDDGSKFFGPGVADMKSGCLFALYAAEEAIKQNPNVKLAVFYNGQHEEDGAIGTRPIMEALSAKSKIVIATEAARANGNFLKQRKGISRYTITFNGKSAHAGVNPQEGRCAITEMAHWIIYLSSLTDYTKGTTVNCGVVKGGTVPNAIADFAELKIDVRAEDYNDAKQIEKLIFNKVNQRHNNDVNVEVKGRITRPPMKPTAETDKLCDKITELGKKYGIKVTWGFSGGGSDASFASGMGITAIDGICGVGGNLHTDQEYLIVTDIDKRYELFANIVNMLTK